MKDLKVNDRVKAFDFQPIEGRDDSYIDGVITEVKDYTYIIRVIKDSVFPKGSRKIVETPKQGNQLWEFDNRVSPL
jgi:hypothetical protein